jgi:hypothetical protein
MPLLVGAMSCDCQAEGEVKMKAKSRLGRDHGRVCGDERQSEDDHCADKKRGANGEKLPALQLKKLGDKRRLFCALKRIRSRWYAYCKLALSQQRWKNIGISKFMRTECRCVTGIVLIWLCADKHVQSSLWSWLMLRTYRLPLLRVFDRF